VKLVAWLVDEVEMLVGVGVIKGW